MNGAHRAFVAGATGYTGRELVPALVRRGVATVAHVRPDSGRRDAWTERFEEMGAEVDFTPWERDAFRARLSELSPTIVFALLGITRARAKAEGSSYDTVDYGLTALLMKACEAVEPLPRFVYLSSAGVPDREPGRTSYMHARWQVEKELGEGPLPYVIARPSIITGDDRDDNRPGERVGAKVMDGALAALGAFGARRLRDRYRSTTNAQLAEGLVRVALEPGRERSIAESEDLRAE